jgi:hypothetical protein
VESIKKESIEISAVFKSCFERIIPGRLKNRKIQIVIEFVKGSENDFHNAFLFLVINNSGMVKY